jgi:NhaP-type Na+/H+ and K+/H+ antiporter
VVGTPAALERCLRRFCAAPAAAGRPRVGWPMSADAPWAEVSAAYGLKPAGPTGSHASLGRTLESIAGRALSEGDRVRVGRSAFTVTEVDPNTGRPTRVLFEPSARADPAP